MIPKHFVDWLSPALGLIGSLLLAWPFFADYATRLVRQRKIREIDDDTFGPQEAKKLRSAVRRARAEELLEPDPRMAFLAALGCLLLIFSFLLLLVAAPEQAAAH